MYTTRYSQLQHFKLRSARHHWKIFPVERPSSLSETKHPTGLLRAIVPTHDAYAVFIFLDQNTNEAVPRQHMSYVRKVTGRFLQKPKSTILFLAVQNMNRTWKIGFIITSEVCEEVNREESVYIDDKTRPWIKKTPKKLIAEDVNIDKGTDRRATSGDVSIALYIADKYKNVKVDIIPPHEITSARLKKNHVNFIILYDLLESFHTVLPGTTQKISKILSKCDNVYPSNKMMRCINYKQNYYKYMQKHGVPIAAFKVLHRKDWIKLTDSEKVNKIKNTLRGMKGWNESFVTKPVFGQESIMVKVFNKAYSKEYIASYVDSTMKLYPGVIFQEYMRNMATKECCEFRCYFVGDKFAYCIITNDEGEYIHKAEGGRKEFVGYHQAVQLAHKAIKKVPQSKMNGVKLPRLMTRIDVGTAVKRNTKTKDGKRVLFVSEVELVPSLFIETTKKQPDVLLGDQIMNILEVIDKNKACAKP